VLVPVLALDAGNGVSTPPQPLAKLDSSADPCLLPPFASICPGINGLLQTMVRQQETRIQDLKEELEERQVVQVVAETHSANYQSTIKGLKVGVLMVGWCWGWWGQWHVKEAVLWYLLLLGVGGVSRTGWRKGAGCGGPPGSVLACGAVGCSTPQPHPCLQT
jgi:hypothetical protein